VNATRRCRKTRHVGVEVRRARPLHAVIRGAADKEPFAAVLRRRPLHDRLEAQTERIRDYLGDDLRRGLSVDLAGQRFYALASPELY
jgi:hypothetical protein